MLAAFALLFNGNNGLRDMLSRAFFISQTVF